MWSAVCSMAPNLQSGKEARHHCAWTMELPKTCLQAIDLIPSCSKQALSNRLNIGQEYESTKLGCIFTLLHVPSTIRPMGGTRLMRSTQLSSRPEEKLFWPSTPIFISCLKSVNTEYTELHRYMEIHRNCSHFLTSKSFQSIRSIRSIGRLQMQSFLKIVEGKSHV